MATTIKLKNSVTSSAAPSSLTQGEAAVNVTDKKLWVGNAASSPVQLIGTGASVNFTTITTANDASISGLTVGKGSGSSVFNTAIGSAALLANTSAVYNTAVGYQSSYSTTTGGFNASFGGNSLLNNTTGSANAALGQASLQANTTGGSNVAVGQGSLQSNTTASNNTAVGYQAGYNNSTGVANAFFGNQAGYSTTGGYNQFFGFGAGYAVTSGNNNTILGAYSGNQGGLDIRTASNYIVLSDGAGNPRMYSTGATDWYINGNTGSGYSTLYYAIGSAIKVATYYQVSNTNYYISNNSNGVYLTTNGTSWTSASDERLKENLVNIDNGLEKVCSLRSVIGNFISDKEKTKKSFLIAQDVQKVLPEAVSKTSVKDDETEYLGVSYTDVIPLLVAAIKELNAKVEAQALEIATLKGAK